MKINTQSLTERVHDLHRRILDGDMLGAFEDHYAEDVVMREPNQEPRVGKDANRAFEEHWHESVTEFREVKMLGVAINEAEGLVFSEWYWNYTHKEYGERANTQVSIQTWRDGQVVEERFYY